MFGAQDASRIEHIKSSASQLQVDAKLALPHYVYETSQFSASIKSHFCRI